MEFEQLKKDQSWVDTEGLILDPKAVYKSKKGAGYPKTLVNFEEIESLAIRAKWQYQAYITRVRQEEEK